MPHQPVGVAVIRIDQDTTTGKCDRSALDPRLDLCNHSPAVFEWGYGGSGPAQLALALLADALELDHLAEQMYQTFKQAYVSTFDRMSWSITRSDLIAWAKDHNHRIPVRTYQDVISSVSGVSGRAGGADRPGGPDG